MIKRIRAALLALCMALSLAPVPALAQVTIGKCGKNVYYSYDPATYELTITGTGDMASYEISLPAPWKSFREEIENVSIASSITGIGSYAFYSCRGLTSVTIPDGVTSIGESAFNDCYNLEQITIPDSVTSIGDKAFYLTAYYVERTNRENGVLYIGNHLIKAFDISGEYEIKSGTKTIAGNAFDWCNGLTAITIPGSVTYIGDDAFSNCTGLTAVTIPDSVLSIGNQAFSSCTGLTSITIPKGVTSIGDYVFQNCCDLAEIKVAAENNAYCSENGVLYDKEKTEIICFPKEKQDTVFDIPGSVISIATGAFSDCLNLTGITIPNGVSSIGDYAFYECSGLTSIIIPDGVPSLGLKAFYGCSSLESVTIPNSVISIGEQAFLECGNFETINYIGTDSEWKKILRGDKCSIDGKTMKYCKGINAKHTDVGIVVRPINIDSGKTVILALYNGDKLVGIQSKIYGGTEVTFETNEAYSELKAMVWEDLAGMLPVCGAKTIK